jgi:hypothetical protein
MMDKRIAEIRKDEFVCTLPEDAFMCPNWSEWADKKCEHPCDYKGALPYSTDIRYAMELWEEMKAANAILELCTTGGYKNTGIACKVYIAGKMFLYKAETEAEAIAGAYLKWREDGQ